MVQTPRVKARRFAGSGLLMVCITLYLVAVLLLLAKVWIAVIIAVAAYLLTPWAIRRIKAARAPRA